MKPSTNYEKFITDDFSLIQDCFEEQGYSIKRTDFHLKGGVKGRLVEKALLKHHASAPNIRNGTNI